MLLVLGERGTGSDYKATALLPLRMPFCCVQCQNSPRIYERVVPEHASLHSEVPKARVFVRELE